MGRKTLRAVGREIHCETGLLVEDRNAALIIELCISTGNDCRSLEDEEDDRLY